VVRERNESDAAVVNCDLEREERRKLQSQVAVTFETDGENRGGVVSHQIFGVECAVAAEAGLAEKNGDDALTSSVPPGAPPGCSW
jgi:hypothetical protein